MNTAVIIARFQTPYLHEGHRYLLDQIKAKHHKVVVVLGVSPAKGTKRNPFDFYTREKLIKSAYPSFTILPLADQPSDEVWSNQLDELLVQCFPDEQFVLYGGRDSFTASYSGRMQVMELPEQSNDSATDIRTECADKVLDSEDFRLGINYACHNMYAKVYPTVDIALFKDDKRFLLLGKKKQRNVWQLPGGFVDLTDPDYEYAAKRELHEECGDFEVSPIHYVGSTKIDDWRYRKEEDKIMTSLFAADLVFGYLTAHDDLHEIKWFSTTELRTMIENKLIAAEHVALIELLFKNVLNDADKLISKNFSYEFER